jgi:hypothetical protein
MENTSTTSSVKADLESLEKGISLIEMAYTSGLQLLPDGEGLDLQKDPNAVDYNREQASAAAGILKQNSKDILAITTDPDGIRELLAQSQLRMITAHEWLVTHLDLWDRLEKAYRAVFRTTECVMGENRCHDYAVVRCKACERGVTNGK